MNDYKPGELVFGWWCAATARFPVFIRMCCVWHIRGCNFTQNRFICESVTIVVHYPDAIACASHVGDANQQEYRINETAWLIDWAINA